MEHMVLKYLLQERDIENSIGYGYRMRKIIEHAKISLRQKAVEYYGWSYIRSMFAQPVGTGNSGFFCVPGGIRMFCEYDSIYCLNNITCEIVLKTTIKGKL